MRLWSIHPKYLDKAGLLALWRESLLAKKVLEGKTKGYKNHPQLERFKKSKNPPILINKYLETIFKESLERNYKFDESKIQRPTLRISDIEITKGQINYEFKHLLKKLEKRDKVKFNELKNVKKIETNKIFKTIPGKIESWEKLYVRKI